MSESEEKKFHIKNLVETKSDWTYLICLIIALLSMIYELTGQEYVRELQAAEKAKLTGFLRFLNDNFVGDIGNAFAFIFGIPFIVEVINFEIQKGDHREMTKKLSELTAIAMPYLMTIFFIFGAADGETSQTYFKWGTPDKMDLVGAYYGTAVALVSILRARKLVYPRQHKEPSENNN